MNLKTLLEKLKEENFNFKTKYCEGEKARKLEILDVYSDSREKHRVESIFVATKGLAFDGHIYALELAKKGLVTALLVEREIDFEIPQIIVVDSRFSMGLLASILYGKPTESLKMIGITGTNGKTTTSFIIRSVLNRLGVKTGMCGTIFYDDGKEIMAANHTTPEGCDLQRLFKNMVEHSCKACVMEVSSHSLAQGRVAGCRYDEAVFTNLTEDHLDFHGDMENYFEAKKMLFGNYLKPNGVSCIVIDSTWGRSLAGSLGGSCITISIEDRASDIFAHILSEDARGVKLELKIFGKPYAATIPFVGRHNVYNAICAVAVLYGMGLDMQRILSALATADQVPGRLERYSLSNGVTAVIDFAHTPDGLEKALSAMKQFAKEKLICVFGAGGNRDKAKRPIMGCVASRLCDKVIITSDNPRNEDPMTIIDEIEAGMAGNSTPYEKICDRRLAIYSSLDEAKDGDVVVIAGRGHETHQILSDKVIPLNDKEILLDWLKEKCVKII